ncbi:hypothetical protein [Rhodococcus sp. SGAir0479]|uniref:hypothetical protein n=1 Tax=Rhodococcus sp. SGAir0479 TaxID=2567884 RepID=UPI0015867A8B|nr:hypothetical protein [Rhodococcus sp. SGAir0479]
MIALLAAAVAAIAAVLGLASGDCSTGEAWALIAILAAAAAIIGIQAARLLP